MLCLHLLRCSRAEKLLEHLHTHNTNGNMSGAIAVGLGLAALGFGGRAVATRAPNLMNTVFSQNALKLWANSKYYRGGFDSKMSRREAALVLGVSPNTPAKRIKDAHKRIMLLNHPDRGGSPFMAAKINEAKEMLS